MLTNFQMLDSDQALKLLQKYMICPGTPSANAADCQNAAMGMNKLTRRLASWIASFAILLAALAPSLTHSVATAKGDGWIEVCSSTGSKLIQVGSQHLPEQSDPAEKGSKLDHCAYCFTPSGPAAPPPSAESVLPAISGKQPQPPLFYQSPRPLFVWAAAHSRAPPVIS